MKIAVSGKGGVGKTTLSSNLIRLFAEKGYNVYAVDADADSSLGLALGIDENELEKIKPIAQMKEMIGNKTGDGAMYSLNPIVDDIVDKYSLKIGHHIKFLRMGDVKRGGSECYCRENTFLKALVNSLILDTREVVILDMGAGIEHLTRGTARDVDLMIIVTEPGMSSVQTARVVESLSKDLQIKNILFVANKVRTAKEEEFIRKNFKEEELLGILHYDDTIAEKSMGIIPASENIEGDEFNKVLEKIISMNG